MSMLSLGFIPDRDENSRIAYRSLLFFLLENRLVLGAEPSTHRHGGKGDEVGHLRNLAEDDEGKKRADKGRHSVVCTGPCRAEDPLCVHVKEDAQPVRHKSHAEHGENAPKIGQTLSDAKPDDDGAKARKDSLQEYDLQGILGRELSRAVVFKAPAHRRQENEQRSGGKLQTADILKGQQRAGQYHEEDARPQAFADFFPKDHQRNDRRRHDLKVVQQRHICCRGVVKADEQKNGRRDIQHDHRECVRKLRFRDALLGGLYLFPFADQSDHAHAKPRTHVQKSCHQGGGHIVKEQLGKRRVDGVQRRSKNG